MSSLAGFGFDRSLDLSPAAAAVSRLLTPKIEPINEPAEYFPSRQSVFEPQGLTNSSVSGFTPAFFSNFLSTPPPSSATGGGGSSSSSADINGGGNLYSEFYRVAEAINSEFVYRLRRCEDVTVLDSESGAIVPSQEEKPLASSAYCAAAPRRPKQQPRSSELVRISNLGVEAEKNFREVVKKTRMLYDSLRIFLTNEEEKRQGIGMGKRSRAEMKAASMMKDCLLWLNRDKRIVGSIPGVQIGDIFFFRVELCVVGLHGQTQAGIDFLSGSHSSNGEPIATSIIVSGGYEDDEDAGDVIVYTGHGGQDKLGRQAEHQRLEGGNLAMERSMYYGIEVRVIRGIKYENYVSTKVYVYDGLFRIVDCWFDVGKSGFGVFKYRLERIEGQPEMGSSILKFAKTLRTNPLSVRRMGYLSFDISNLKENAPVYLYNDIDSDHEPLFYEYLAKTVFPPFVFLQGSDANGCNCASGCGNSCLCAMKNGGEFAYDYSGNLMKGKPLIYECGPSCQCPPNCQNRATQRGLKNRLEVFRSRETGWGVRPLDVIHAGAFICEYAGVALTREQAEIFSMNGDTLVYPGRFSSSRWADWGDLSQILMDHKRPLYPSFPPLNFAMDVSKMRNVACYISHSSDPNVMVQFVLYAHNNTMFPHVMLFAMENILPLTELSLDYGVADEWTPKLALCN